MLLAVRSRVITFLSTFTSLAIALSYGQSVNVTLKLVNQDGKAETKFTIRRFTDEKGKNHKDSFKGLRALSLPTGRYEVSIDSPKGGIATNVAVGYPETLILIDCERSNINVERLGPRITEGKILGLPGPGSYWLRIVPLFEHYGMTQIAEVHAGGEFTLYQMHDGIHLAIILKEEKIVGVSQFSVSLFKSQPLVLKLSTISTPK